MVSPERYIHDSLMLMDFMQIGENADTWPLGLLRGGEHFADIDGRQHKSSRLGRRRIAFNDINPQGTNYPRNVFLVFKSFVFFSSAFPNSFFFVPVSSQIFISNSIDDASKYSIVSSSSFRQTCNT